MIPNDANLPALDQLVHEIKTGRRVLLFPPGVWVMMWILLVSMVCFSFTAAFTSQKLTENLPVEQRAIIQLSTMVLAIPGILIPMFMITRGKKNYANWQRWFLFFTATLATVDTIMILLGDTLNPIGAIAVVALLWSALALTFRPSYILFCEFYYRLKRKP